MLKPNRKQLVSISLDLIEDRNLQEIVDFFTREEIPFEEVDFECETEEDYGDMYGHCRALAHRQIHEDEYQEALTEYKKQEKKKEDEIPIIIENIDKEIARLQKEKAKLTK